MSATQYPCSRLFFLATLLFLGSFAMGEETTPKYAEGDLDQDGDVAVQDIDLLYAEIAKSSSPTKDSRFDLNEDGKIDQEDVDYLVFGLVATVYGDANLDGVFDSTDIVMAFQLGEYEDKRTANSTWETGDFNGDLEFDASDLPFAKTRNKEPDKALGFVELTKSRPDPPEKNKNGVDLVLDDNEKTFRNHVLAMERYRIYRTAEGEGVGDFVLTQKVKGETYGTVIALKQSKKSKTPLKVHKKSDRIAYSHLPPIREKLDLISIRVVELETLPNFEKIDLKKVIPGLIQTR